MFCSHCGKQIEDNSTFCPYCGATTGGENGGQPQGAIPATYNNGQQYQAAEHAKGGNGMAIAGFVCSFFIPLLGWIFGGIGLSKSKKLNGKGKGLSIAALIIATIMFIVNILLLNMV